MPPAHDLTVPVGKTAVRTTWSDLPQQLRDLIEDRLGSPVVGARSQRSGFTSGLASRLVLADGSRVFCKAAHEVSQSAFVAAYHEEIRKLALLPEAVPAPRLRWSHEGAEWVVLCFDDVAGRPPRRPWDPDELASVVQTVTAMSLALDPAPPALADQTWAGELADFVECWDRVPMIGSVADHRHEAVELARHGLLAGSGTTLAHCDLRDDNVIIGDDGKVWVCDWNWPVVAAPWVDLVTLLISAVGDGHDGDAIVRANPLTSDLPAGDIDGVLALLAGYFLDASDHDRVASSPWIRLHQRWYADVVWAWLSHRRGW